MQRKEIEKVYIKKIKELKKHNKAYFNDETSAFMGLCISSAAAVGTIVIKEAFHFSTRDQKLSNTPSPR